MSGVVTVPELLDGHTVLDIECLDRLYLNGYVPKLQVGGQVITFLHDHLGMPIVSPAVFEQIGTRFRRAVARFADSNGIPVIKFKKGIRKAAVMEPLLRRAAAAGRSRVVAIGWAQEFQLVWEARKRDTDPAKPPQFSFAKAERRVTCYYFYIWDEWWGPGFIKVCAYFPYPAARSSAVKGSGSRDIHRSKNAWMSPGPSRSQISCRPSGSSQQANPLDSSVKP